MKVINISSQSNKHTSIEDGNFAKVQPGLETLPQAQDSLTSIIQQVRECVQIFTDEFTAKDVAKKLPYVDRQEISRCLKRLLDGGTVMKIGHGIYRRLGSDDILIMDSRPTPVPLQTALGLEEFALVFAGELIVVAGVQNGGKSGWLMDLAWRNRHLFPGNAIKYFSSEWGSPQLTLRAHEFVATFGMSLDDWRTSVSFKECPRNVKSLANALEVDRLNVVDYLTITDKAYQVANHFDEIHQRMKGRPGIAVVAIQMKHGRSTGRGDSFSLERPTL